MQVIFDEDGSNGGTEGEREKKEVVMGKGKEKKGDKLKLKWIGKVYSIHQKYNPEQSATWIDQLVHKSILIKFKPNRWTDENEEKEMRALDSSIFNPFEVQSFSVIDTG